MAKKVPLFSHKFQSIELWIRNYSNFSLQNLNATKKKRRKNFESQYFIWISLFFVVWFIGPIRIECIRKTVNETKAVLCTHTHRHRHAQTFCDWWISIIFRLLVCSRCIQQLKTKQFFLDKHIIRINNCKWDELFVPFTKVFALLHEEKNMSFMFPQSITDSLFIWKTGRQYSQTRHWG